jgi:RNA polymerase sigma factor (sigma-70 family)
MMYKTKSIHETDSAAEHSSPCSSRDLELLARTRAGDADAFSELYAGHVRMATSCALRYCRQRDDAADICSGAFLSILLAVRNGNGPTSNFDGYVRSAIRRSAASRARAKPDIPLDVGDDEIGSATAPVHAAVPTGDHVDGVLSLAMSRLPADQRRVLWLAEVMGFSAREIATKYGGTANSVAALAYRARNGLRRHYLESAGQVAS